MVNQNYYTLYKMRQGFKITYNIIYIMLFIVIHRLAVYGYLISNCVLEISIRLVNKHFFIKNMINEALFTIRVKTKYQ